MSKAYAAPQRLDQSVDAALADARAAARRGNALRRGMARGIVPAEAQRRIVQGYAGASAPLKAWQRPSASSASDMRRSTASIASRRFRPQPTKVRALEHIEAGGGMAANAAVAIARLGGKAELWSRIGDDARGQRHPRRAQGGAVDVRYVQAFEGARSSTSAIIVDDKGERLIVGQRDAGMPSGHQLAAARARQGGRRRAGRRALAGGLRTVFARARKEKVPTVLDADLGAREALGGILKLTDYAIFSRPGAARVRARRHRRGAARARAVARAQACRRHARARGLPLARARRRRSTCRPSA